MTSTYDDLVKAVLFLLGNPFKLFFGKIMQEYHINHNSSDILVPSILIGAVELALRWKFPTSFNIIFDVCNDFKFLFIFIFGYGLQAGDEHGMKSIIRKGRWYYLIIGNFTYHMSNLTKCECFIYLLRNFIAINLL